MIYNPPSISLRELKSIKLEEQVDGNWIGTMGDLRERQNDPRTIVEMLLTHK